MKRKDTKSKALISCFRGKSTVSSLEGTRFKPCLLPFLCTQIFLGLYITRAYIYDSHLVPIVTITPFIRPSHCTFLISSIPYDFHAIAENLHDNGVLGQLHTTDAVEIDRNWTRNFDPLVL